MFKKKKAMKYTLSIFFVSLYASNVFAAGVDAAIFMIGGSVILLLFTSFTAIPIFKVLIPDASDTVVFSSFLLLIINFITSMEYYWVLQKYNVSLLLFIIPYIIVCANYFLFFIFKKHKKLLTETTVNKVKISKNSQELINNVIDHNITAVLQSLNEGANPREKDDSGYTALDYANGHGFSDIYGVLIAHNKSSKPTTKSVSA